MLKTATFENSNQSGDLKTPASDATCRMGKQSFRILAIYLLEMFLAVFEHCVN